MKRKFQHPTSNIQRSSNIQAPKLTKDEARVQELTRRFYDLQFLQRDSAIAHFLGGLSGSVGSIGKLGRRCQKLMKGQTRTAVDDILDSFERAIEFGRHSAF